MIFSASADGRVVWSDDKLNGGGVLREATLPVEYIAALRERLSATARALGRTSESYFGPDATFTTIRFRMTDGTEAEYASWHEQAEANGRVVATERGLESRGQAAARRGQSTEAVAYAKFRAAWAEMRKTIEQSMDEAKAAGAK